MLAVVGLIFLMVFIALPVLQKKPKRHSKARDTDEKM